MRTKTLVGLLSCMAFVLCLYVTPSANAASAEEEVMQVMNNWIKAFNTNDTELMSSLHWISPSLSKFGPGKGAAFLTQGESIADWKSTFALPVGTFMNSLHNPQVTMLSDNIAIITMYNNQTYTDQTTKVQTVGLYRGTFVVQKIGGKWLIVHEHSSALPIE
jgi:hypothetical protein